MPELTLMLYRIFISPCILHVGLNSRNRTFQPSYEFYHPSIYSRQLGFGQVIPSLPLLDRLQPRAKVRDALSANVALGIADELQVVALPRFFLNSRRASHFTAWWSRIAEALYLDREPSAILEKFLPDYHEPTVVSSSGGSSSDSSSESSSSGYTDSSVAVEVAATREKAADGQSGSGTKGKRPHQSIGLTGYTSGNLGVNSPSLEELTKDRQTKKPKSTKAVTKKNPKRKEKTAESSSHVPADIIEPTASTQAAGILATLQGTSAADPPLPSPDRFPAVPQATLPLQPIPAAPQAVLPPQPTPDAPTCNTSTDPMDLLGFSLDDLEVMASDDYVTDLRNIINVSKKASKMVVCSEPTMQDKLNRLFNEVSQPEAQILANTQPLRDAMAAVEADLPPETMEAILGVCHLDEQREEVEAARARIALREAQKTDRQILDRLVTEAKDMKRQFDKDAAFLKSTKAEIVQLESAKKQLEEELAKLQDRLVKEQAQVSATAASLSDQKQRIGQTVAQVREQSAKIIPVPGSAQADEKIVDGVQAALAKAAGALSALGARLPGSGL